MGTSADAGAACAGARRRAAVAGLALALLGCGGSDPAPAEGARRLAGDWPVSVELPAGARPRYERVVLVTIDTLRADHVSAYGYPRATTPFLDRLARQGVLFARANATISHTAPSHSSMLTGLPPIVHGVLHNGYAMDEHALDLARVFSAAGYETAAIVNTEFLAEVARSFDVVHPTTERGEDVLRLAQEWLASEHASGRFFLWVHLFDPHRWKDFATEVPDGPLFRGKTPPDFRDYLMRLHGLERMGEEGLLAQQWETVLGKTVALESVEQYLRYVDAYDALILYSDRLVKSLYETVAALAPPPDAPPGGGATLWIVTSDHGEGLASHGTDGHGAHIYQEQLAVPFVVHASDGSLGPRRVDALVTHLDIYPTLVEALGGSVGAPAGLLEGRSLWPWLSGESPDWSGRALFAQRKPTNDALYALQDERWKLLDSAEAEDELYDLARDPRELDNAIDAADAAQAREALARELAERLRVFAAHAQGGEDDQTIPDALMEELRDLGYVR